MRFRMFLLGLLVASSFCFLMMIQRFRAWLGDDEYSKNPLPEETVEEAIAREARDGSSGAPAYPLIPVMLWWQPFSGDVGVQKCGDHQCYFTTDRQYRSHPNLKTILFYGTDFKPHDVPLPRRPGEDWALFNEESPKNNAIFNHEDMMNMFNHTATFRRFSDFPLTMQYLESLEQITDPSFLIPVHVKNKMVDEGLAPVAYVQSGCDCPTERDQLVEDLMKYIKIDSYGSCLHNKDLPEEIRGSEKMDHRDYLNLLAKYKYVIAVENAVCKDYVTEKLWRTLQVGSVPIYLGAPNIQDYLPHPDSAILIQDFSSAKDLADHILNEDDEKYKSHLKHKLAHNDNQEDLISNQLLKEMMEARTWGVSSQQQFELGNFVKHFQCFVCERVARNNKFVRLGFQSLPFNAGVDHYGCPVPTTPFSTSVDKSSWWVEKWFKSKIEAHVLNTFVDSGNTFTETEFFDTVMEKRRRQWKENQES